MPMRNSRERSQSAHAALAFLVLSPLLLTACSANRRPPTSGVGSSPVHRGIASWYGPRFHGRRTASGERYNMNDLTAAHRTLPFGTLVEVRNVRNGRSVVVRINDRGPYSKNRVIDLSFAAAREIGAVLPGTAPVELYLSSTGGAPPRFTVQVAAFSEEDRAQDLKRDLSRIYPEAVVRSDGTWNRVQVGAFEDRDQAETLRRELAALGMTSFVVAAH